VPTKKEKQPMSVTHPELAKEADGWDPNQVSPWSNKKLGWKCTRGHEYLATPAHRCFSKSGCPYCSGNKVLVGFNDLKTTHPELASEASGWNPQMLTRGSPKKVEWECKLAHKWIATIGSRTLGKNGCPYCGRKKVLPGFNDLKTTHPDFASEALGWDPTTVISGNTKVVSWKCTFGHIWKITPHDRTKNKSGCPICLNTRIEIGTNDLLTTHPVLAAEMYGSNPQEYVAGSHKKAIWKCKKGHIYSATVRSRVLRNSGCAVCSNQKVERNFNDLTTTHPLIAMEAFGWDPATVTFGSSKKREWKCKYGHVFEATVSSRINMNSGCSVCSNRKVLVGFNDLETISPTVASEAYGWDPKTFTSGSHKKRTWKCKNGHLYEATIKSRVSMNSGCAVCANQKCLTGFNDLATTHPELAKEAFDWDPTQIIAGYSKNLKWKCEFGHIWKATGHDRSRGDTTGCPSCAKSGFDPNLPSHLYFLVQVDWQMYQIGITNNLQRRLNEHGKNGWEPLEMRGPMDGHLAQQWERSILRMLRSKGADLSNAKIAGKFDGYSEAWSKSTFDVKSIKELMRLTEAFEEN
jgi:hypothetical protein